MSLVTFKNKSINKYSSGTKISGKPSNKYWIYASPYGDPHSLASQIFIDSIIQPNGGYGTNTNTASNAGFSLNGVSPNIPYTGRSMAFSKSRTPFRGTYPIGWGGTLGRYPDGPDNISLNMPPVKAEIRGNDSYVRPSVLSTRGMLERKYRWIHNGQYPNYWVQPVYTGNQTDTASQGVYLQKLSAENDIWYDVNNTENYIGYYKNYGPMGCQLTPARGYKMNIMQANAPYTKTIRLPKDSSQYTLRIQRRCQNPQGAQKPFPYAVQTGTGILRGGTSVTSVGSACNTGPTYLTPPKWYTTQSPNNIDTLNINLK